MKGPLDRIMQSLGLEVSPYGVAQLFRGFLDGFVIDNQDRSLTSRIQGLGMRVAVTNTIMDSAETRASLASETIKLAERVGK